MPKTSFLLLVLVACGPSPKAPVASLPSAVAPQATPFGGSPLADLTAEVIAFADAALAGRPLPYTSFLLPEKAAGMSLLAEKPSLPVTWHGAFFDVLVTTRASQEAFEIYRLEFFVVSGGTRVTRSLVTSVSAAPPTPPPTVPEAITLQVKAVIEQAKSNTLEPLRIRPDDLAPFAGGDFVDAILKAPGLAAEDAKLLAASGPIVAYEIKNAGALGTAKNGELFIAIGHLEEIGGRFGWICNGEPCAPLEGAVLTRPLRK
jgi:hypothetical protein